MKSKNQALSDTRDDVEKLALKLADSILMDAVTERASDIHLEHYRDYSAIRFRIDGVLREISRHSRDEITSVIRVVKKLSMLNPDIEEIPQDGRIAVKFKQKTLGESSMLLSDDEEPIHKAHDSDEEGETRYCDFRIATFPTFFGEKMTIRLLDAKSLEKTLEGGLEAVCLKGRQLDEVKAMLGKPYGFIIFSGPTGSGKTSTVYSALNDILSESNGQCNIMTLEEPVEYILPGVTQTKVDSNGEFNYSRALRAMMRMDPDIIFVGSDADLSTSQLMMQIALTGHLVLTQLNSCDGVSAIRYFLKLGVEPYILSTVLEGVINQRLARKICDNCKEGIKVTPQIINKYKGILPEIADQRVIYRGAGCDQCKNTGFRGRIAVYEILPRSELLEELICLNPGVDEFREKLRASGFRNLFKNAVDLAFEGLTSMDEALRVSGWK